MPLKKPPKMARSDPQALGELIQVVAIQRALGNQLERPGNHSPRSKPGGTSGRSVRMTPSAGAKTGRLRSCRGLKPLRIFGMTEGHRADGSAINAGCGDAGKKTSVESAVTAVHRLPAKCRIELQVSAGKIPVHVCRVVVAGENFAHFCIRKGILKFGCPRLISIMPHSRPCGMHVSISLPGNY